MGATYWQLIEPIWRSIDIGGIQAFLESYSNVPRQVALLYAAHFCQSEVCNGGFHQFFFNSTGVLAPEAVQGFCAIGQRKVAEVVRQAMDEIASPYARGRETRIQILAEFDRRRFEKLDEQFFALINVDAGGFEAAAERYAVSLAPDPSSRRL